MRRLPLLLLPLALAACNGGTGTPVTIDVKSDDGDNGSFRMENGTVSIKGDGFQGNFRVPQIKMKADDVDLDGVKLYPKSEIAGFHITGGDKPGNGKDGGKDGSKDDGKVRIDFTSPASLAAVQNWFRDGFTKKGFTFAPRGDGFAGTTSDGGTFTLDLSADGGQKVKGRMEMTGS
ncbi:MULTISPECIES: hypothetical protein [unclassified Sphingomonas]|uniref:hypothetical protein n=1 Tax=Sphingomonas TaxID=13687 RepID=UPI00095F3843|nr:MULTISPECIES: hypothetical protein [unclassified Sphingomonas]MBN8810465.1 hypothetical protein [Sphingomonas sp.]OJY50991.1 MAG: hypothetical protein BGP17_21710 [Sphingomonas sp. 67-41]